MDQISIQPARWSDAEQMLAIYRPYVEHTLVTSEHTVPTLQQFQNRMRQYAHWSPWITYQVDERIAGYAYARPHREREGYRWTVETSVYVAEGWHQRGIGGALYGTLFELLRRQGYYNVFVGITEVNEKSIRFHQKMGFERIGVEKNSMYKFGCWNNTCWMHLPLRRHDTPGVIIPWSEFCQSEPCRAVLRQMQRQAEQMWR